MKKEIVEYLRSESLEDLQRLLDTGITEDEFYQYVGVVQIYEVFDDWEQHNLGIDDKFLHILELVEHEWGKCIISTDIEDAKETLDGIQYLNDKQKKHICMLFKNCYRVLHMQHTQEHTLEAWVKQLHLYCRAIRNNNFVGYVNKDDMFFYAQEEFEEKFYRVTDVCISNLEERTRQQLYDELGMVLTRVVTEDKLKQIILGVL